jgi:hypothetical protein
MGCMGCMGWGLGTGLPSPPSPLTPVHLDRGRRC